MRRFFILSLLFFSFVKADYLYSNKNICIKDFYYKKGRFYYLPSGSDKYRSTSSKKIILQTGYMYDENNKTCRIDSTAVKLGITSPQYYFLMALAGLLLGIVVVFGFARAFM